MFKKSRTFASLSPACSYLFCINRFNSFVKATYLSKVCLRIHLLYQGNFTMFIKQSFTVQRWLTQIRFPWIPSGKLHLIVKNRDRLLVLYERFIVLWMTFVLKWCDGFLIAIMVQHLNVIRDARLTYSRAFYKIFVEKNVITRWSKRAMMFFN